MNSKEEILIQIYFEAKALKIEAEELDSKLDICEQPNSELLCAFDHQMRYIKDKKEEDLNKGIAHVYRAFFDTADWIAITQRDMIIKDLNGYDNETITKVLPVYYQEIRPTIEKISEKIGDLRNNKTTDGEYTLQAINEYKIEIAKLIEYQKIICNAIPSLEEYKRKNKQEKLNVWKIAAATSVMTGVITATIILLFLTPISKKISGYFFSNINTTPINSPPVSPAPIAPIQKTSADQK